MVPQGALQVGDDLAQRGLAGAKRCFGGCAGIEGGIQIRFREAVVGKLQFRCRFALPEAKRVEVGLAVAPQTVGVDELQHAHLLALVIGNRRGAQALRACLVAVAAQALEVIDDGAVGHVGELADDGGQAVEIAPPLVAHLAGIFQVGLEQRLYIGVSGGELRICAQLFERRIVHGASLF